MTVSPDVIDRLKDAKRDMDRALDGKLDRRSYQAIEGMMVQLDDLMEALEVSD